MKTEAPLTVSSRWAAVGAAGFCIWAVGVQLSEGLATVGLVVTWLGWLGAVLSTPGALKASLRQWWLLWVYVAWALWAPLLAARLPTGAGAARLFDWSAIPVGVWALSMLSGARRRQLVAASAVVLLISGAVAGLQHCGAWPPLEAFHPLRWTQLPFDRVYERVPGTEDRFMGGGLLFHRLKFAHVSGLLVIVLGALALTSRPRAKVFLWLAVALGATAVGVFSYARAAMAAMTFALVVLVLVAWGRRGFAAVGALCLAVGVLALSQPALRSRFSQALTHEGSGERTEHWRLGWRAVKTHWLLGMGVGQYTPAKLADAHTSDLVKENPGKSHLQLLSIAAESGVIGVGLFVAVWGLLVRRARHPLAYGLTAYFAVLSLGHDPLYQAPFSMGLMAAWAVALSLGTRPSKQAEHPPVDVARHSGAALPGK
ncbi:MAG: O-antigen ligase family protein [Myxococcaceae bacterium]|nr:O-antigen ligase family protein [Myxococcaceae bacterium]